MLSQCFYSTLVRLKGEQEQCQRTEKDRGFYSTLVRLKGMLDHLAYRKDRRFYSTLVRLKDDEHVDTDLDEDGFYSTLVRLKVAQKDATHRAMHALVSIPHWYD